MKIIVHWYRESLRQRIRPLHSPQPVRGISEHTGDAVSFRRVTEREYLPVSLCTSVPLYGIIPYVSSVRYSQHGGACHEKTYRADRLCTADHRHDRSPAERVRIHLGKMLYTRIRCCQCSRPHVFGSLTPEQKIGHSARRAADRWVSDCLRCLEPISLI